ncbi:MULTISPECIES: hypothetical protein [unclassified Mycobacterium]|uniref:hypothetical protein n=1 Tax=unclassified Mycobacterium TaxID=2642494 RepID=UPI0029C8B084|nr:MULTISPECIES: hypothetical protein [unclassified Mycobacterium]
MARTLHLSDTQIRIGAWLGIAHVVGALVAHFSVPKALEEPLGLRADPWFRRETGTVNAGFAFGLLRILQGHRDPTFLKTTALSGALMAATRTVATVRGHRRGPLSLMVILSDLLLSAGGFALAHQFERERREQRDARPVTVVASVAEPTNGTRTAGQSPTKAASR